MIKLILFMTGAGAFYYINHFWMGVYLAIPIFLWCFIQASIFRPEDSYWTDYEIYEDEAGLYSWYNESLTTIHRR